MQFQQTVRSALTVCLTPGDNPKVYDGIFFVLSFPEVFEDLVHHRML